MIWADTQMEAEERKKLEFVFNNLQKAVDCCRSAEMHINNAMYHSMAAEVKNPTAPGNYPTWPALEEDLTLSLKDVRKELGPAYAAVAHRLYGRVSHEV